ncbi:tyrosine-type recombinase/integrase [Aliidiomarina quisquiliarum]|uniref:tyrosine-type recombinase/integrase n=1 Tax=Aliidiomarina quisquiliarum TaxID=2938947 RepID=UPI00208EE1D4|nr:tyrosine-type recombinase/integrase [Aliidiomarina quisquiliarum]MCO4319993.1 tyrosine-type recombinase/integrase [Aliidiomarina quisquiliarum]
MSNYIDPVDAYLDGLHSEASLRTMVSALTSFAVSVTGDKNATPKQIPWSKISFTDIQRYIGTFKGSEGKSHRTGLLHLSAIRGVLKKSIGLQNIDPEKRAPRSLLSEISEQLSPPKPSRNKSQNFITLSDFKQIIKVCDDGTPAGIRDVAIFQIMYGCGLRRSEVSGLSFPESVNFQHQMLKVIGKGQLERHLPMYSEVEDAILRYLDEVRGEEIGPLFCALSKSGKLLRSKDKPLGKDLSPISPRGVALMVERRVIAAGFGNQYSPHDFRASFATALLSLDVDLLQVQTLMGHSAPSTTERYDLREHKHSALAISKLADSRRR